jgi:hypothetical protein
MRHWKRGDAAPAMRIGVWNVHPRLEPIQYCRRFCTRRAAVELAD